MAGVLSPPEAAMPRNALYLALLILAILGIAILLVEHVTVHVH